MGLRGRPRRVLHFFILVDVALLERLLYGVHSDGAFFGLSLLCDSTCLLANYLALPFCAPFPPILEIKIYKCTHINTIMRSQHIQLYYFLCPLVVVVCPFFGTLCCHGALLFWPLHDTVVQCASRQIVSLATRRHLHLLRPLPTSALVNTMAHS